MRALQQEGEDLEVVLFKCLFRHTLWPDLHVTEDATEVFLRVGFQCSVNEIVGVGVNAGDWPFMAV